MNDLWHLLGPNVDMATFVKDVVLRLLLAAFLGGLIGLEREAKGKAAGLRTNMFICFGAAFFTLLSDRLAVAFQGDHTRIAAQIIPGIGFIGAGSILHSRGGIKGLTTAATLFVVASVGMAAGGGLSAAAIFATMVILIVLHGMAIVEERLNFKAVPARYEVTGARPEEILPEVNALLDEDRHTMSNVHVHRAGEYFHVQFTVEGTREEQFELTQKLRKMRTAVRVAKLEDLERG